MLITKEPPLLKIAEWLQSVPFKTMKITGVLTGVVPQNIDFEFIKPNFIDG